VSCNVRNGLSNYSVGSSKRNRSLGPNVSENAVRLFDLGQYLPEWGGCAFVLGSYVVIYVNNAALQGLQRPVFALWIGLFRQLAAPFLLFPLLAFSFGWGLTGIWWGILVVNWSAAAVSILYTRYVMQSLGVTSAEGTHAGSG